MDNAGKIRHAALITEGFQSRETYARLFQQIRETGTQRLTVVLCRRNTREGLPLPGTVEDRVRLLTGLGADEVRLLPEAVDWLDEESRAFAASQALCRAGGTGLPDTLILPVRGDGAVMESLFLFLAALPKIYQEETLRKKDRPRNALGHIPELLENRVPGSEGFLAQGQNVNAFRVYQVLRSTYSPVKARTMDFPLAPPAEGSLTGAEDRALYGKLRDVVAPEDQTAERRLDEIFYGNDARTRLLLQALEPEEGSFLETAARLTKTGLTREQAQRFLQMALHGFRKIDQTVLLLHGFREEAAPGTD